MVLASWSWSQLFNSPIEVFAVLTGIICVTLLTVENISTRLAWHNWWIGGLSAAAYIYIFWDYGLYFNSGLQVFFIVTALYGAWAWKRGGEDNTELVVERAPYLLYITAWLTAVFGAFVLASSFDILGVDSSKPFWDAFIVTMSVIAQVLMTRKQIQHWHFWLMVDVIAIWLFWSQELYLTSVLYVLYGALSSRGLYTWSKVERGTQPNLEVQV